jgi:CheY-like chemotaxis protein
MTILLVADHEDTRQAMRVCLELSGHSVVEASDVRSALVAATAHFDLSLCDIELPDGDGWTLLKTLRKSRLVEAIAISGYCSQADVAQSRAAGFCAHLSKPFTLEEFEAAVIGLQQEQHTTHGMRK